jgi:hypothetical protein
VILLHHRKYRREWRQQGSYDKSKLEKTASLIAAKSLDVPPEHTHLHPLRCLETPERFEWINFLVSL